MIRPLSIGLVVAWSVAPGLAAADALAKTKDHTRGEQLHAEAVADLKANCSSRSCKVFASNAAKLRLSMKLDPNARHALAFCVAFETAKQAETLTPGLYREAMLMCDIAATRHPNADRRSTAEAYASGLRRDARNGSRGPRLSDPAQAARALYGAGFKVDRGRDPVSFDFGAVTLARLQDFIRDWYVPMVQHKRYTAHVLLAPDIKLQLCKDIAATIKEPAQKRAVVEFCEYQAALEANARMHVFRGSEEVTLDKPRRLYEIQVLPDRLQYEPLVSIAGRESVDDYASVEAQRLLIGRILDAGKRHAYYTQALAIHTRLQKLERDKTKALATAEAKLAAGGPRVVILERAPRGWELPAVASGHLASCKPPFVRAYAKGAGYVELVLSVDGQACGKDLGSGKVDEGTERGCGSSLRAPGKHELVAELFATTWHKTGRKQVDIHRSSIDVKDVEDYKRGRRLAHTAITCGP